MVQVYFLTQSELTVSWGAQHRSYLGCGHKLGGASSNFMRTDHQLLEFPSALYHQISCIPESQETTRRVMQLTAATPNDLTFRSLSSPWQTGSPACLPHPLCCSRRPRLLFFLKFIFFIQQVLISYLFYTY